jgi:hypothetical protein
MTHYIYVVAKVQARMVMCRYLYGMQKLCDRQCYMGEKCTSWNGKRM